MRGKHSRMKGQIFPWRALRSSVLETQKISFTGNTEHSLSAPDTHFHQKLQLKHQTIDIHAHFNSITLLCYVITLFASLLIDTVNIVLSSLDFTQLVKL